MKDSLNAEIALLEERFKPLRKGGALAWWGLATEGGGVYQEIAQVMGEAAKGLLADPERFARLASWHARRGELADPLERRQLEVLYLAALGEQMTPEEIHESLALEIGIEADFSGHRPAVRGEEKSDNDLKEILETSDDGDLRREAWEAGKEVGGVVAERVLSLARLRNAYARRLGRRDYYALMLESQEVDEVFLYSLLDDLDEISRGPYLAHKARDDEARAARFGVGASELRPWHYDDPFGQSVIPDPTLTEPWFEGLEEEGLERLCNETYDSVGLDLGGMFAAADLYERPGKNQHAFCMMADRDAKDVRILCNLRNTVSWAATILHEFGHGIYDKELGDDLPWFLKTAAHTNSTEAIAMIFGRQAGRPDWLVRFLGAPRDEVEAATPALTDAQNYGMLTFSRWMQVMTRFERALYADPEADLSTLWWDLVEKYQAVPRPEKRSAPDWAAKIHLATAPVYYHNYMIGEMTASQLERAILDRTGGGLADNEEAGALLKRMFALGATLRWDDLVTEMTGESLSPAAWAADFAHPPA